jgi:Site-specific recombinases, DNA invertase Pin homologs
MRSSYPTSLTVSASGCPRWYREIVSGDTIAERPQVRQLLEDVGSGLWDGVLVVDVDRLGRGDSIDQGVIMQTFMYAGVLIVTPDKTYDPADDSDAEFFEIKLSFPAGSTA